MDLLVPALTLLSATPVPHSTPILTRTAGHSQRVILTLVGPTMSVTLALLLLSNQAQCRTRTCDVAPNASYVRVCTVAMHFGHMYMHAPPLDI